MSDARPAEDGGVGAALGRNLVGALVLIAVVAAAFWAVGRVRDNDPGDGPIITGPSTPVAVDSTTPSGVETSPGATTSPSPEPSGSVSPEPTGPPPDPTISPSAVSIQILDAAGDDGTRADAADEALRAAGYNVIVVNRAVRVYEESTLFYSEGQEGAAQQIAASFPQFTVVQPKPDNLSSDVAVHVVVGRDYPDD